MSSDIITCLQLNEGNRLITVKEINGCDSSFINSCILSHCIKNKKALLIIANHNTKQHYQNVGLKMNYNLQKHVDSRLIQFFNLGEEAVKKLLLNDQCTLQKLFLNVKEIFMDMQANHGEVNVIIEGISHLFDLQYTLAEVNNFCIQIIELITSCNNSFVICHCNNANEDDVTHVMSNLLTHKSDTVLEVENLISGWSADVSGHLTIKNLGEKFGEHIYNMDIKPSRYLFKLFDRGVKLFAPGTV